MFLNSWIHYYRLFVFLKFNELRESYFMKKKLLLAAVLAASVSNVFASEYSYEIISSKNKNADLKELSRDAKNYVEDVKKFLTDAALTDEVGKVIYLTQKKEVTTRNGAVVCLRHVTIDQRSKEKALYRLSSVGKNATGRVTNEDDLRVFLSGTKDVARTNADKAATKGATKKEKAFLELTAGTQFQFGSSGKTFQGEVVFKPGKSLCIARVEIGGQGGSEGSRGSDSFGDDEGGRRDNSRDGSSSGSRDSHHRIKHDNYSDNNGDGGDNYNEGRRGRDRD